MAALRQALRSLARQPALAAAAAFTFALGLGLAGAMFCLVRGILRELPFPDSGRLVHLELQAGAAGRAGVPFHDLLDWRRRQTSFVGLAAYAAGGADLASPGQPPERVRATFATADLLALLGVAPALGRPLLAGEDDPEAPRVALLGDGLWRRRFGGDPGIVGRTVRLDGQPTTVVGILPAGFRFPLQEELWLPLRLDPRRLRRGEGQSLEVLGRLRDGVPLSRARQDMAAIVRRLAAEHPAPDAGTGVNVAPLIERYVPGQLRALLWTLLGAVLGVLLVAAANVANLLLARAARRGRELAVRAALGASRGRIARQLLAETCLTAAAGALAGLALTAGAVALVEDLVTARGAPFWMHVRLDLPALAVLAGLTLLAALLAGLAPALRASGGEVHAALRDAATGASGPRPGRLARALVVAEIAVTFALLAAAGAMARTVINLRTVDYGFDPAAVLTARVTLAPERTPDPAVRRRFFAELERRLAALPGVEAAALASQLPATPASPAPFALEGRPPLRPGEQPHARLVIAGPGLLAVLGLAPTAGRDFEPQGSADGPPVALINEAFRARYLPGEDPVGRRLRLGPADRPEVWRTIVGMVPDLHLGGIDDSAPEGIYVPVAQSDAASLCLLVRPAGDPLALAGPVRRAVQDLDPALPVDRLATLAAVLRQGIWHYDLFGTLFLVFGGAALFLATVGLAGVVAGSTARRTHEIGTRRALGARGVEIGRLVLGQAGGQVAAGLVLGLLLALPLTGALRHVLFEVSPWDPWTLLAIAAVLLLAGLAACLAPLHRAVQVDPATALRGS